MELMNAEQELEELLLLLNAKSTTINHSTTLRRLLEVLMNVPSLCIRTKHRRALATGFISCI